jgi:hypothetical protein
MYRIRFFSSFGESSECKPIFERLCETNLIDNYGSDKHIYITNDDDYTHVVILNTAQPDLRADIPKENVIGLAFEPLPYLGLTTSFLEYAEKHIGKYYLGDKGNLPDPFVEHYSYMWHSTPLKYIPEKKNCMSLMISLKYQMPGHKYRHEIAKRILEERLPIDIFGRGCDIYNTTSTHLKGNFKNIEPYESYDFHIAIENIRSNHYFSEKITNPLLCGTTPIYLGCKNINSYFSEEVIGLSGDIDQDIKLLKNILREPEKYKRTIDVEKVKNRISFVKNVDSIFS